MRTVRIVILFIIAAIAPIRRTVRNASLLMRAWIAKAVIIVIIAKIVGIAWIVNIALI